MTDIGDTATIEPPLAHQLSRIDQPLERKRVGDMVVDRWAGLTFAEYRECVEFAKVMAQARNSIPGYLKENPGDCLAIVTQSLRWRLEPYWVAQHSYVAKTESLIAYDAAVHAAILLSSGLLKERPRYTYKGEGEERTCTVTATFKGESTAVDYETPPLRQCRPPKNQDGVVKGSPLWTKDPDQQLGYYAVRNFGRRHAPELLGGVYDREEFENTSQDETNVIPPSPNLMARLPGKMEGAGFAENVVDTGLAKKAEKLAEKAKAERKATRATGTAGGEAEAKAQAETAPQENKPAQEAPVGGTQASPTDPRPNDAGAYMAYASKWIERTADPDNLEARWDGEKEMRAELKVPIAMRKRLQGMLDERVAELRAPKKRK
jgi:RecT family protein